MSQCGTSIARVLMVFCMYQLLVGRIKCANIKRNPCDFERIKYQIYKTCQYKREADLREEKLLYRTHRIDEYDPQSYVTEVDETGILGFPNSPNSQSGRIQRYVPIQQQIPNGPYQRLSTRPGAQPVDNYRIGSLMFPDYAQVAPSNPLPPLQRQQRFESRYSQLNPDQKRTLRNLENDLVRQCCASECDFKNMVICD